jgi:hypothetical protein
MWLLEALAVASAKLAFLVASMTSTLSVNLGGMMVWATALMLLRAMHHPVGMHLPSGSQRPFCCQPYLSLMPCQLEG